MKLISFSFSSNNFFHLRYSKGSFFSTKSDITTVWFSSERNHKIKNFLKSLFFFFLFFSWLTNLTPFSIHGEKVRFPISQQILKLFHILFPFIHHQTQQRICIKGLFSDSDEENQRENLFCIDLCQKLSKFLTSFPSTEENLVFYLRMSSFSRTLIPS